MGLASHILELASQATSYKLHHSSQNSSTAVTHTLARTSRHHSLNSKKKPNKKNTYTAFQSAWLKEQREFARQQLSTKKWQEGEGWENTNMWQQREGGAPTINGRRSQRPAGCRTTGRWSWGRPDTLGCGWSAVGETGRKPHRQPHKGYKHFIKNITFFGGKLAVLLPQTAPTGQRMKQTKHLTALKVQCGLFQHMKSHNVPRSAKNGAQP